MRKKTIFWGSVIGFVWMAVAINSAMAQSDQTEAEATPADAVQTAGPAETTPIDPVKEQQLLIDSFGLSSAEAEKILADISVMKMQRLEEQEEGFELPSSVPGYTRDEVRDIEEQAEEVTEPSLLHDLKDREEINP